MNTSRCVTNVDWKYRKAPSLSSLRSLRLRSLGTPCVSLVASATSSWSIWDSSGETGSCFVEGIGLSSWGRDALLATRLVGQSLQCMLVLVVFKSMLQCTLVFRALKLQSIAITFISRPFAPFYENFSIHILTSNAFHTTKTELHFNIFLKGTLWCSFCGINSPSLLPQIKDTRLRRE